MFPSSFQLYMPVDYWWLVELPIWLRTVFWSLFWKLEGSCVHAHEAHTGTYTMSLVYRVVGTKLQKIHKTSKLREPLVAVLELLHHLELVFVTPSNHSVSGGK